MGFGFRDHEPVQGARSVRTLFLASRWPQCQFLGLELVGEQLESGLQCVGVDDLDVVLWGVDSTSQHVLQPSEPRLSVCSANHTP